MQDIKSGLDISTRGFGDTFHTEAKVDPSSGRKLGCMKIEDIAELFHDTVSRTEASVVIVDGMDSRSRLSQLMGNLLITEVLSALAEMKIVSL